MQDIYKYCDMVDSDKSTIKWVDLMANKFGKLLRNIHKEVDKLQIKYK